MGLRKSSSVKVKEKGRKVAGEKKLDQPPGFLSMFDHPSWVQGDYKARSLDSAFRQHLLDKYLSSSNDGPGTGDTAGTK